MRKCCDESPPLPREVGTGGSRRGSWAAVAGGTTLLMAPDGAWAMTLETLSGQDGATLLESAAHHLPA